MDRLRFLFILIPFLIVPSDGLQAGELLSWDDCVSSAMRNNPDLVSSREKVRQSKADIPLAAEAYIPQLGTSFGVSGSEQTNPITQRESEHKNYSVGLNGKQMLFDGLKTVYNIKSAQSMVQSAKYDADIVSALTCSKRRR